MIEKSKGKEKESIEDNVDKEKRIEEGTTKMQTTTNETQLERTMMSIKKNKKKKKRKQQKKTSSF